VKDERKYNATVYDLDNGGVFVAEVDDEGFILRSNWIQCTGLEGTREYDAYIRSVAPNLRVVRDNCESYRQRLASLMLPPAYR